MADAPLVAHAPRAARLTVAVPEDTMPDFPVPAAMAHMVLRSADIARLAQWYCTVLGCEVVHEMRGARRILFLTPEELAEPG